MLLLVPLNAKLSPGTAPPTTVVGLLVRGREIIVVFFSINRLWVRAGEEQRTKASLVSECREIISRRAGKQGRGEKKSTAGGFDNKKAVMCSVSVKDI